MAALKKSPTIGSNPSKPLATIRKHRQCNVPEHLVRLGSSVRDGWQKAADKASVPLEIDGIKPLSHFSLSVADAQAAHTLLTQLMLDRGYLAGKAFYATFAHQDDHVDAYLAAFSEVLSTIAEAIDRKELTDMLEGPPAHTGFTRLV